MYILLSSSLGDESERLSRVLLFLTRSGLERIKGTWSEKEISERVGTKMLLSSFRVHSQLPRL